MGSWNFYMVVHGFHTLSYSRQDLEMTYDISASLSKQMKYGKNSKKDEYAMHAI